MEGGGDTSVSDGFNFFNGLTPGVATGMKVGTKNNVNRMFQLSTIQIPIYHHFLKREHPRGWYKTIIIIVYGDCSHMTSCILYWLIYMVWQDSAPKLLTMSEPSGDP